MKSLQTFIYENEIENLNEGLLDKLKGWFKNLFKSQETLKKETIKVDVKNLKSPKKPTKLKDIENNDEELKLINDRLVGFPVTASLIKEKNKYLVKEDEKGNKEEYEPLINRYFYVGEGGNKYDVGIIMYDEKIKNDNNYINMLNLETIAQVDNKDEVEKTMNINFEDIMKKKYKGAQYISKHPRVKARLIKQGYKSENNNTDILFKNF